MATQPDNNIDLLTKDKAIIKFLESTEWAIIPSRLEAITKIVSEHMAGECITVEAASKAKPRGLVSAPNVAVIPIEGTIAKKLYGLQAISGGETTRTIQDAIQQALDDRSIDAIVLSIDSPGGTVDGTKELADFIYAAREQKPIVAYADGLMASAAYWIGSAANKIVAFSTAQVGSIGVIVKHQDWSKAEQDAGVSTTFVYAGKYKAYGNSSEPLTEEPKQYMQSKVDYYYTMFTEDVAKFRNEPVDYVLKNMAEGKILIGEQAKEVKLVDSIGNIEDAIRLAQDLGGQTMAEQNTQETLEGLQKQLAALTSKLEAAEATAQEEKAEREALQEKVKFEKHEALIKEGLAKCKLDTNAELVKVCSAMDADSFGILLGVMQTQFDSIKKLQAEYEEETPDASTKSGDSVEGPNSINEAVALVEEKYNLTDVDEAIEKAQAEYPELFKHSA